MTTTMLRHITNIESMDKLPKGSVIECCEWPGDDRPCVYERTAKGWILLLPSGNRADHQPTTGYLWEQWSIIRVRP